jgi:Protein of unknown function (DUF3987)
MAGTRKPIAPVPAEIVDKLTPPPEAKVKANGHSVQPIMQDVGETGAHWVNKALDKVTGGAHRNETGHWLACQLRDAGMPEPDAGLWMEVYAGRVPVGDHPYTEREALATLRSAYGRPPRERAKGSSNASNGNVNGYASNALNILEAESQDSNNAFNAYADAGDAFPVADTAMYYSLAGDIVGVLDEHTEASPVALLAHFLVSFGNAVGRSSRFLVEDTPHHANLFAVLVGPTSGGRKGTARDRIERVFNQAGRQAKHWLDVHVQRGLSSGEGLIYALRDARPDEDGDKGTGGADDDNELLRDKRLLVCEDEFASVLKVASREGNILSAVLRVAWDGKRLQTLTKHAPLRATDAHVSVMGHITAAELLKYLTSNDASNGLANRFLWIATKRARELPFGGDLDAVRNGLAPLLPKLNEALMWAGKLDRTITWDAEARAEWKRVYKRLTAERPGLFGSVTARAAAQVTRLALVYALLDCEASIGKEHLRAALAFWRYCEDSARSIFGDKLGDRVADALLAILKSHKPAGLTRAEMYDKLSRNASKADIDAALQLLASLALARGEKESTGTPGRPTERWRAL